MITKEQNVRRYCCLYVSNFHLEMILLPYIKKMINKTKVMVFTEENLLDSLRILMERTNLKIEDKNRILEIKSWKTYNFKEIYKENEEYTIIINGNTVFRNEIYKVIENIPSKNLNIVDCYDISKESINKKELKINYEKILNTEAIS